MKRPRQTEDECVLRKITKASDALLKKYKQPEEQKHVKEKVLNDMWKPVVTPLKKWVEQKKAQSSDGQKNDPETSVHHVWKSLTPE